MRRRDSLCISGHGGHLRMPVPDNQTFSLFESTVLVVRHATEWDMMKSHSIILLKELRVANFILRLTDPLPVQYREHTVKGC